MRILKLGRTDLHISEIGFGFLQQHPDVIPIPGMRTKAEVDEIVGLYLNRQPLLDEHVRKMEEIRSALGEKFCHRCEYCMPCGQGVQIPGVLIFRAAAKRLSKDSVSLWLGEAMKTVAECIECGECEHKCPYQLPITDLLKENLALYSAYNKV